MKSSPLFLLVLFFVTSCNEHKLPVLNEKSPIPAFSFTDQNNQTVTDKTFEGKIYVADFIFLSCTSICPKMNMEMLKVYTAFQNDDRVLLISHTIDPQNDSIAKLKAFATNLGVSAHKWHFVTGNVDSIYSIAQRNYFTSAEPDSLDNTNFLHGGGLLLVDKAKRIRGVYDGTEPAETEKLIKDIRILLKESY